MTRQNILIGILLLLVAFAIGRYTTQATVITKTVTKTDETQHLNEHQHETIVEKKSPDGTDTVVTTIDSAQSDTVQTDTITQSQTKTVTGSSKINLSALATTNIHSPFGAPAYGLSVSKEVAGPITAGLFGLSNGTVGISIGINF
jgi:hypothetical protein